MDFLLTQNFNGTKNNVIVKGRAFRRRRGEV